MIYRNSPAPGTLLELSRNWQGTYVIQILAESFCMQSFLRKTISYKMFHPDYKHITDKLPVSIKDRAYQRLLNHSRNPIPLEQISEKNKRIEDYLQHTLEIYQKSLDRSRKTMDRKKSRPQSWPKCPAPL